MNDIIQKKHDKDLHINWFGVDGVLVLLYGIIVSVIFYATSTENDFLIGMIIPYGVIGVTALIFISYLFSVMRFMATYHEEKQKNEK